MVPEQQVASEWQIPGYYTMLVILSLPISRACSSYGLSSWICMYLLTHQLSTLFHAANSSEESDRLIGVDNDSLIDSWQCSAKATASEKCRVRVKKIKKKIFEVVVQRVCHGVEIYPPPPAVALSEIKVDYAIIQGTKILSAGKLYRDPSIDQLRYSSVQCRCKRR